MKATQVHVLLNSCTRPFRISLALNIFYLPIREELQKTFCFPFWQKKEMQYQEIPTLIRQRGILNSEKPMLSTVQQMKLLISMTFTLLKEILTLKNQKKFIKVIQKKIFLSASQQLPVTLPVDSLFLWKI
ncbi:hypothetical protein FGO68_gene16444 [Halteria grandinella]|uniref:Uncharacterized protein n=1 Tax=Halteria grandinella TaxID=5974 RepID=A0A8J8SV44_HALGN|nr:hypothetical protein FGO68_gene16444 [Halteria grandinella]